MAERSVHRTMNADTFEALQSAALPDIEPLRVELTASTECHCCRESFQYADEPDAWQLATCPGCDRMQWFCDECVDEAKSSYFPADRPIQHGQIACGSAYILGCSGCLGCVCAERIRTAGPLNPDAWWIGGPRVRDLSGQWWIGEEWGS